MQLNKNFLKIPKHVSDEREGEEELAVQKRAFSIKLLNKQLSASELVAQALMFLLAGYETTSTTLTTCAYELALHPEIQQRLYEEITDAMDADGT